MTTQMTTTLLGLYGPIEKEISEVESLLRREFTCNVEFVDALSKRIIDSQGKLIRPALLFQSANICGGIKDIHIKAAVIIELTHNATLVHDDVLDEAGIRRNKKTINAVSGNEAAVIFGDYLFSRIFALSTKLNSPEALDIISTAAQELCIGELTQISHKFNFEMNEEEYLNIVRLKTASLFAAACKLGAVDNQRVNNKLSTALEGYGLAIGIAFQIVDDILDITGSEDETGKSLGTDIDKGKMTLPMIKLLNRLPAGRRADLLGLLSSKDVTTAKRNIIAKLVKEYDVIEYSLDIARRFINDAKQELSLLNNSPHTEFLYNLSDFVISRRT